MSRSLFIFKHEFSNFGTFNQIYFINATIIIFKNSATTNLLKLADENSDSLIQYENQADSLTVPAEESDKKKEK